MMAFRSDLLHARILFIYFCPGVGGGEISYKQMPSKQKQNNQGENENNMADKHGRCKIRLVI